ncbi:MAG: diguanylate cyclase [Candidatus Sedimenticola sp. 6PFRAG7]
MVIERSSSRTVKERTTQRYLGFITLLTSLVVASSFLGFTFRTNALFDTLLLEEARAFQKEVSLVRSWIRDHGGVYVRSGDRAQGAKRQIVDQDGEVLLQRNTSEVTQELSQLSREKGIVQFGSTSLAPLNPTNKPDDFERKGLMRFSEGEKEVYGFELVKGKQVFRYMSPLVTRKKCLNCHTDGSFQTGRVDSAMTFSIPADSINHEKHLNRVWMTLSGIGVIVLISISIWLLARRFIRQLADADRLMERLAAEDVLTGLLNRRMGMERLKTEIARCKRGGRPLSLAMLDIDHFKRVNDTMGHSAGDEGLRALADIIRSNLREYDIAFRYGGEEFVLVLPDTPAHQAMNVAERLRAAVECNKIIISGQEHLSFTISIGVEQLHADMEMETLMGHADDALYAAKKSGRNRSVLFAANL